MKRAAVLAFALASAPGSGQTALPSLPRLTRVRAEVTREYVTVMEDVDLWREGWQAGDLDLYVAFGAPGAPRAIDARLSALADGGSDPGPRDVSEPIPIDRAPRKPKSAAALLGPALMAGAVLHVRESAFRRAVSPGGGARIRIRSLYDLPQEDASTGREIVVRLGIQGGAPIAVDAIEIGSAEPEGWLVRAEAHLCGQDADPYPLAVTLDSKPKSAAVTWPRPTAPVLAVRHDTDDLCLRVWTR